MIDHLLPGFCYPNRPLKKVDGVVIHYFSARNVDKDNEFDMETCRDLFLDLNRSKNNRKHYMLAPKWPNGRMHASAHILIGRDGTVWRLLPFDQEAWHAGQSVMNGRSNCNKWTIGIELIGHNTSGFTKEQYTALARTLIELEEVFQFARENIQGHDSVRWAAIQAGEQVKAKYDPSGRKDGEGSNFDWFMLGKMMNDIKKNPAGVAGLEDLDAIISADPCSG